MWPTQSTPAHQGQGPSVSQRRGAEPRRVLPWKTKPRMPRVIEPQRGSVSAGRERCTACPTIRNPVWGSTSVVGGSSAISRVGAARQPFAVIRKPVGLGGKYLAPASTSFQQHPVTASSLVHRSRGSGPRRRFGDRHVDKNAKHLPSPTQGITPQDVRCACGEEA